MPIAVSVKTERTKAGVRVALDFSLDTEVGFRVDRHGQVVRPHFVESVVVALDGRTVLTAALGSAVARRPQLMFHLPAVRAGALLTVDARDNRGASFGADYRFE